MITPELLKAIDNSPLGDLIAPNDQGPGYLAPRLEGIWSRFPYLHNGSVPSLAALLTPEAQRPSSFSLRNAGEAERFDQTTVGLTVPKPKTPTAIFTAWAGSIGSRSVFHTNRPEASNQGHPFGTRLAPDEKRDLIEYLKTL